MDLVLFVLSVVGLCGSVALCGSGVSMLRHHKGNHPSTGIVDRYVPAGSKVAIPLPPVKIENGKHDILSMCREIDAKLSGGEEHTELMVIPEQAKGEQG